MSNTISDLLRGERAIIKSILDVDVPLKLIEMGCVEGNYVEVLQKAPLQDPVYLNISGTYLAIRQEVASKILVEKL